MKQGLCIFLCIFLGLQTIHSQENKDQQKIDAERKKIEAARKETLALIEASKSELSQRQAETDQANIRLRKLAIPKPPTPPTPPTRSISGFGQQKNKQLSDAYQLVTYRVEFATGKLELNFAADTIESYDGKEIILTSWVSKQEEEATEGLVMISGNGIADNTGIGLHVDKNAAAGLVSIMELDMNGVSGVKVMIPRDVKLVVKYNNSYQSEQINLINIQSETEVAVRYNPIKIHNVTGAATINSMYGNIDATFKADLKSPVSLVSSYGNVNVTVPTTAQIDLNLKTSWGKIYVAEKIVGNVQKDNESKDAREQLKGKLNGGGTKLILSSGWGKIYLRTK